MQVFDTSTAPNRGLKAADKSADSVFLRHASKDAEQSRSTTLSIPRALARGSRRVDVAVGWPTLIPGDEIFLNTLKEECQIRKLSFVLVNDKNVTKFTRAVKKGKLKIRFYLDMVSEIYEPRDKFTRFSYCLKDAGTRVIADPDDVKEAGDKSITHFDLLSAKIPTPFTVVIRNWEPTKRLPYLKRRRLGFPFVIKPALGYGQKGVKIINERRPLKEIAKARRFHRGDNFLLQEFIEPLQLNGFSAWFRVYHLFGELIPCWWHPKTHLYRQVTLKEMDEYLLLPLVRITAEIARITRVDWFSCEIAINKRNRKFVVIDYMNDQCAIYPQSKHRDGVPDDLITHIAERMAEKAWQYLKGRYTLTYRAVWFPKIKVKDENA